MTNRFALIWHVCLAAVGCLALASSAAAGEGRRYTLADLQALASQSGWSELVAHLGDIPPTSRGPEWLDLAEQAGVGAFAANAAQDQAFASIQLGIALLDQYPQLKGSRRFLDKRAEVGLLALGRCFERRERVEACGRLLTVFAAQDGENLDLSFRAGKLASRHLRRWYAVSFFRRALALAAGNRSCADEDVKQAMASALALKDSPDFDAAVEDARVLLRDECWPELSLAALDLFHGGSPEAHKHTCDILKAKNALGKVDAAVCATLPPEP